MGPPTATMDVDMSSGVEESKVSGVPKPVATVRSGKGRSSDRGDAMQWTAGAAGRQAAAAMRSEGVGWNGRWHVTSNRPRNSHACFHPFRSTQPHSPTPQHQEEEQPQEEQPDPLKEALEAAEETAAADPKAGIAAYHAVLATPGREGDEAAQRIKEEAIYRCAFFLRFAFLMRLCGRRRWRRWRWSIVSFRAHTPPCHPVHMTPPPKKNRLARLHANAHQFNEVMALLQTANAFFAVVPKAKTAKIVRTIIDIVAKVPDSVPLQVRIGGYEILVLGFGVRDWFGRTYERACVILPCHFD